MDPWHIGVEARASLLAGVPDFGNVFVSLGMTLALIATETHQKKEQVTEAEAVEETLAIIDK